VGSKQVVTVGAVALAALTALTAAGWTAIGWSFREAVDAFVVSNLVIGLSFGLCGALIAWYRPRHPVGWLYLAGGTCQLLSAAAAVSAQAGIEHHWQPQLVRALVTVFEVAWPIHIGLCLPLSLMLLPDGHLPGRAWRPWFAFFAITSPMFVLENGNGHSDGTFPDGYLLLPVHGVWATVWTSSEIRWAASMLVGVLALTVRYRRGDDLVRRQLLWVVLGAGLVLVAVTPWALVAGTPLLVLFSIPVLPLAIAVAILRHGLLDIRLVIARSIAYLLLSALVLAVYALLVVALSGIASALVAALLALPLRARLQAAVERVLYGARDDPAQVATEVGGALHDLDAGVEAVRRSLRLRYVAVRSADATLVAEAGTADGPITTLPMPDGFTLRVGPRPGERELAPTDERLLAMLTGPLAVAVTASTAAAELRTSRERLVSAREEERRRLRRELHDGVGTLLTGVVLAADAAGNLISDQPGTAAELIASIRGDLRHAVAEVRRLVEDLRPLAVDELGLVRALEVRATQTVRRADGGVLQVEVQADLADDLPAALEVAAYRIATEALNNVVRHSQATRAVIRLRTRAGQLEIDVLDDGPVRPWKSGVGTTSMAERAEELGGTCDHGPGPAGGAVRARIPIGAP
jgi:signal transduction histidine kinase